MSNYDDILRRKENEDSFDDSALEKHWAALEHNIGNNTKSPKMKYRKLIRSIIATAAVLIVAILGWLFFTERYVQTSLPTAIVKAVKSAIAPPLPGANMPYEIFSFDAALGDTLFTLNGSVIVFPKNAVLNSRGEVVTGSIEVRTREFNDPFDYSIAGIPMDYDSAGIKYQFISSGMIDIGAYQNGEVLQVNPNAKPQLNLVSTNTETKTNLYQLDTVTGKWLYKGKDEVNRLTGVVEKSSSTPAAVPVNAPVMTTNNEEAEPIIKPVAPEKASNENPVITINIDPESFKELQVYNGLKFEVIGSNAEAVGQDADINWTNVELKRVGEKPSSYEVIFSAGSKRVAYKVKPVLEGKDFEAAEKLYQEKLKEYTTAQAERKQQEQANLKLFKQKNANRKVFLSTDSASLKAIIEENKRVEELNRLMAIRNKFIEAENKKVEAINKENRRLYDSIVKANQEIAEAQKRQYALWEQENRTSALEQNLIRSFAIDGFGYWNCDQPTLPEQVQYVSNFKTDKNEGINYVTLCIAAEGINRIQNFYYRQSIGLIPNTSYFGWAYNESQFYYFTKTEFNTATRTANPNTITITMKLYEGEAKNYAELKGFLFNVNNSVAVK